MNRLLLVTALTLALSACTNAPIQPPSGSHLNAQKVGPAAAAIPAPVQQVAALPKPRPAAKVETYSVVVNNVRVQELLFALARDAKLNVDIHPGIDGLVTLNAIDQTIQQLLTRIAKQVDIRWEIDGQNLAVMPDKPYLKNYKIDFPNITRSVDSSISTATQIASASTTVGQAAAATGGNSATTKVTSTTKNDLMESLIQNVSNILKEEDRLRYRAAIETQVGVLAKTEGAGQIAAGMGSKTEKPNGAIETAGPAAAGSGDQKIDSRAAAVKKIGEYEPAASVFANKETGVLIVRATHRQHEKVQQFIDQVMNSAKRQVLIEATIVEVELSDAHKQGINWSYLRNNGKGFSLTQADTIGQPANYPLNIFKLTYASSPGSNGNLSADLSLLESFGNVKVLSSPKLSVMNNQTASLKVAENLVYFTVKADTTTASTGISQTVFTTTPQSVSVGFFMNVTPHISDNDEVTINLRPTITRLKDFVDDPNPSLKNANVTNKVPQIISRELESIIKVNNGQVAVMGGLMQDQLDNKADAIPGASTIPILGNLFRNHADINKKTELVIFLRPIVIKDASIQGDFADFRSQLPGKDFFEKNNVGPVRQQLDFGGAQQ